MKFYITITGPKNIGTIVNANFDIYKSKVPLFIKSMSALIKAYSTKKNSVFTLFK
jgi:hypothetical protein